MIEYPYSEELAKKIKSGEIKGSIVTRNPKYGEPYKCIEICRF